MKTFLFRGLARVSWLAWAACTAATGQPTAHNADPGQALIVGVGQYSPASGASALPGVARDVSTARQMAAALGIPENRVTVLRDAFATKPAILAALQHMQQQASEGQRVFIYFSGHGTSYTGRNGCEQGFVPYTADRHGIDDVLTEAELAGYTARISQRVDKAIVLIDACYSGGMGAATTRSLQSPTGIRAKVLARSTDACSVAVNVPSSTRSFTPAMQRLGVPEQNFVQISAAKPNEVSWDNEELGGLATHSLGQCLLGQAEDLNRSGSITLEEVRHCAQIKLDALMAPHRPAGLLPSSIQIRGARNLIVVAEAPRPPAPPASIPAVQVPSPATLPAAPPVAALSAVPAAPLQPTTGIGKSDPWPTTASIPEIPAIPETPAEQAAASLATLQDILAQRNGRLRLEVASPQRLSIGKDNFKFSVKSNTAGYLYALMLGSDGRSFYLLFPNKLDQDNRIKAHVRYDFPRTGWSVRSGGPEGTNRVLFVVSPSPRDLSIFSDGAEPGGGAFTYSLTDLASRRRVIDFLLGRGVQGRQGQMAAVMIDIEEVR